MSSRTVEGVECGRSDVKAPGTKDICHYSTLSKLEKGMCAREVIRSQRRKKGIADDEEHQHHPMYHTKRNF